MDGAQGIYKDKNAIKVNIRIKEKKILFYE